MRAKPRKKTLIKIKRHYSLTNTSTLAGGMFNATNETFSCFIFLNPNDSGERTKLYVNCIKRPPFGRAFSEAFSIADTTFPGRLTNGRHETIAFTLLESSPASIFSIFSALSFTTTASGNGPGEAPLARSGPKLHYYIAFANTADCRRHAPRKKARTRAYRAYPRGMPDVFTHKF